MRRFVSQAKVVLPLDPYVIKATLWFHRDGWQRPR
jgi:hypothetical protein